MSDISFSCSDPKFSKLHDILGTSPAGGVGDDSGCAALIEAGLEKPELTRDFFVELTGREIPWVLDDFDPKTADDAAIRKRADDFTALAKKRLEKQGFAPGSHEFNRRLGISLYLFAQAPKSPELVKAEKKNPDIMSYINLWFGINGMQALMQDIKKNGGLGLSMFSSEDAETEATALETLRGGKGICTERSKVIYAVLKRAGLKPYFIHITGKDSYKALHESVGVDRTMMISYETYMTGHVAIALDAAEDGAIYLEPNYLDVNVPYAPYSTKMSLREMYQADLSNLAQSLFTKTDLKEADIRAGKTALSGGLSLGKSIFYGNLVYTRAIIEGRMGNEAALDSGIEEALKLNPTNFTALLNAFRRAMAKGDFDAAKRYLKKLPPESPQAVFSSADLALKMGETKKALRLLNEAQRLGANSYEMMVEISCALYKVGKKAEAIKTAERAIAISPTEQAAYLSIADMLAKDGKIPKAADYLSRLLLAVPIHLRALIMMAKLQKDTGNTEIARRYHRRAVESLFTVMQLDQENYESFFDLSDAFGEWERIAVISSTALNEQLKNSLPVSKPSTLLLYALSRFAKERAAEFLPTAMGNALHSLLRKDFAFGVTPSIYWRFADVAEKVGNADLLREFLRRGADIPEFSAYLLHWAFAYGGEDGWAQEIENWNGFMEGPKALKPKDWNAARLAHMERIAAATEELPIEMLTKEELRTSLAQLFEILGRASEILGQPRKALPYYKKSLGFGDNPNAVKRVRELEKALGKGKEPK
ncbi:MAG TPA: tetratricopeptide repeat protein [bacterium]|nr:tetratricopeptide repeat protein [bacterium]